MACQIVAIHLQGLARIVQSARTLLGIGSCIPARVAVSSCGLSFDDGRVNACVPCRSSSFPSSTSFSGYAARKNVISTPSDNGRFELRVRFSVSESPWYSSTTR